MFDQIIQLFFARSRAVFVSHDSEADFRSRMIGGLAGLMIVFTLPLIVDDILAANYGVAILIGLIPLGMFGSLWLLFTKRRLDSASLLMVGSILGALSLGLLLSGGSLAGSFVATPLVVLLASVLCTRKVALILTAVAISACIVAMWLSTTEFVFPLSSDGNVLWLLGRTSILISIITTVSILLYRDSAEQIRNRAALVQMKLELANTELSSVVQSHISSAQLMFKVQEIGDLIGWWYEPESGRVHYTASKRGEFMSFDLKDHDDSSESVTLVNVELRDLVARRVENAQSWDDEARIIGGDGEPRWYRDSGEVELDGEDLVRVVGVLQDITSTKTLTDQLELHANFDELTGLLNRRIFWSAVEKEHANFDSGQSQSHLLFIDLDQFKLVNDASGHVAGDRLLQIVAGVLKDNVHKSDTVGRVGGDEFGVIIRNCSASMVAQIADRLRAAIEQVHFHWSGETFRIGASVGAIGIDPSHGTADELQQLVDAACYEAKLAGRNRVSFFEGGEEQIAEHRGEARWVQRLHDAMEHNRFELHGQLIKPVEETGEASRYEVLIRLREPGSDRLIPPGAFLPAAERFGLSPQVDQWVLGQLLKKLHADPEIASRNRKYWVNLSGNSIGDKQFAEYLIEAMQNSNLPEGMVNFEITETAVIRNMKTAGDLIAKLGAMGCQFALDDFGSGLSSFGYLKKFPVDYLKIDGMFVKEILNDEVDRVFVRAIISIAKTMGIKTVAEFVENDEIYRLVEEFGVDYVQGYGIHRPEKLLFYGEEQASSAQFRKLA